MKYVEKLGYGLIAMGIFIFILGFYVKNYNSYFLVAGISMFLIGFLLNILLDRKDAKVANKDYKIWKETLMKNGLKIEVNLSEVEIKSSNYSEEIINEGHLEQGKYKALDTFSNNNNPKYNNINESILVYETQVQEKIFKFYSPIIYKDKITLHFILNNKKKTFIYQDKININNYFFDIEFIYQ